MKGITAFCTDLTASGRSLERTDVGISSLMDTWLLLQVMEASGERNRGRGKLHQGLLAEETQAMARARKADDLPPQKVNAAKSGKGGRK